MWNMRPDPPYIPAKFGEDSLKPKKVMAKNHRILNAKNKKNNNNNNNNNKNNNNKNTDETLQEQKDIPIHGDVLIRIHTMRHLFVRS